MNTQLDLSGQPGQDLGASASPTALSAPAPSGRPLQSHGAERLALAVSLLRETVQPGAYGLRSTLAARIEAFLKDEA
jgi:hypothetical protein